MAGVDPLNLMARATLADCGGLECSPGR